MQYKPTLAQKHKFSAPNKKWRGAPPAATTSKAYYRMLTYKKNKRKPTLNMVHIVGLDRLLFCSKLNMELYASSTTWENSSFPLKAPILRNYDQAVSLFEK